MIFVDSNVILDIVTDDKNWATWSLDQVSTALSVGPIVTNAIVYAETSVRIPTMGEMDDILARLGVEIREMPKGVLFLAGKAFGQYRNFGGSRAGILPDFLIGAHAAYLSVPLLTRDTRRYRSYFPQLELIAPDSPAIG